MKQIPVLLILVLAITSCRKNPPATGADCRSNCVVFEGVITDTPSNAGLADVRLRFTYRRGGFSFTGSGPRELGTAVTDAAGRYSFRFDATEFINARSGYFVASIERPGYLYDPAYNDERVISYATDTTLLGAPVVNSFALYRNAQLTVRFRAATVTNFEFLTYAHHFGSGPAGNGLVLNGRRSIDTTVVFRTAGDIPTYIQWDATGNGVTVLKRDTLLVPAGGNRAYTINL